MRFIANTPLSILLSLRNPDAQSSVWVTPPFSVDEAIDLRVLARLSAGSTVMLYPFIYEDPAIDLAILARLSI